MGWVRRYHQFQAMGSTTRIIFDSYTSGVYGPAIDHIIITAI